MNSSTPVMGQTPLRAALGGVFTLTHCSQLEVKHLLYLSYPMISAGREVYPEGTSSLLSSPERKVVWAPCSSDHRRI